MSRPSPAESNPLNRIVSESDISRVVGALHHDAFEVLGMHPVRTQGRQLIAVRAFLPGAEALRVLPNDGIGEGWQANRLHPEGFFEALILDRQDLFDYQLEVFYPLGVTHRVRDPYGFPPVLSDYDLYLYNEGSNLRVYNTLGAHPRPHCGVYGVAFAVWAPEAQRVSVTGDFNGWDGRKYPMRCRGSSGVWELFVPELEPGAVYKYEIKPTNGPPFLKSDPFGSKMEFRPKTGSVVHLHDDSVWTDEEWMDRRREADWHRRPIAVYEIHPGSWRRVPEEDNRPLSYRELAHQLVDYVVEQGFTHVELMPVMEHPLDESWGYQVSGFYAPTRRYGEPEDFKYLVNHCHRNGIGVILDWVPAHFPSDAHGLARFDGTALYEHEDPRQGAHPDWGTMIFNYGRKEVQNFLSSNALYWFDKFHIDGLRVDAVASMLYLDYSRKEGEWVPNFYGGRENLDAITFMQSLNKQVYAEHPGTMMIAEESTAWPGVSRPVYLGGLGYGFKWNMGWMNDMLAYMSKDPVHRKHHHDSLTFGLVYAFHENFILPLSHDEVVHGKGALLSKMPGDDWQKFANLRLFLGYMYGHPGKKLLFMGGEFGQSREWNQATSLDWHLLQHESHAGLQRFVRDLNHLYTGEPSLFDQDFEPHGFEWIDFSDTEANVIAFARRGRSGDAPLIFVCNFTPVPRTGYRVGVARPGHYDERLNSDAADYWGSGMGNSGGLPSQSVPWHGHAHSLLLTLPPLSLVVLSLSDA